MAAIDREVAEQPPHAHSPYRVPTQPGSEPARGSVGETETEPAMIFATVVLLVASLVRLEPPFTGREAFGVEPTLALGVSVGCAWLALRECFYCFQERRAARERWYGPERSSEGCDLRD
jgi:hypothetical protein